MDGVEIMFKSQFYYNGYMDSSMQSIPLGNGTIGANVWGKEDGIYVLMSHTDAFSELHRLLKTGYIKISFEPNILEAGLEFLLSFNDGMLKISNEKLSITVLADALNPVYKIFIETKQKVMCKLSVINYRDEILHIENDDRSNYQLNHSGNVLLPFECTESKDELFSLGKNSIGQYHKNDKSIYSFSLEHQGLDDYNNKKDPLLDLTFGFLAKSDMMKVDNDSLVTDEPCEKLSIDIFSKVSKCLDIEKWKKELLNVKEFDLNKHKQYWQALFSKSYIHTHDDRFADEIAMGYLCQRYMNICAGRGTWPIKFNGSIFTCQTSPHFQKENYDYRNWGGFYWCQNTRLIYWNMLFSGDYDLMMPFFNLYIDNLDFAVYRTRKYFNHSGAFFPETMSIFATYADNNYGWNREGKDISCVENEYIRWHFNGALEVAFMMLMYFEHTKDFGFADKASEFIYQILLFYREHYETESGKLKIEPTSSLETWQNCINDTPTIAGLKAVCEKCMQVYESGSKLNNLCRCLVKDIPEIPLRKKLFKKVVAPFEKNKDKKRKNCENPELYTVFPYRIYCIGKKDLKIAVDTFKTRAIKASNGWQQHAIQAAMLGLKSDTKKEIIKNYFNVNKNCIFPSFFGPNNDWLPDQDNGSVANIALIQSLVQYDDNNIYLFPSWDKKMSVEFRLPVADNYIEVTYKKGCAVEYAFEKTEERKVIIMI